MSRGILILGFFAGSVISGTESVEQKLKRIAPVKTTAQTYFGFDGRTLGPGANPEKAFPGVAQRDNLIRGNGEHGI